MNLRRLLLLILLPSLLLLPLFTLPASATIPALLLQKTWGGSNADIGRGVAAGSTGNIYVTGETTSFSPGFHSSISLLKYDTTGALFWQKIWSGSASENDIGYGVVADVSGNIYVTGYTQILIPSPPQILASDVLLLKFDSSGNLLWQRTWGGSNDDAGYSVAVDSSGNIYVTGYTWSFGAGGSDVLLLKFDPHGSLLWQKTWGGSNADIGRSVAVDSSGNIYVTGYTNSFGAGGNDVLLLKFDSSGSLLWQLTWGGSSTDAGYGVAVDASGNVYVTGYTNSTGAGGNDVLLLKFDSAGSLLLPWQKTWGGSSDDEGFGVAVDSSGNVYVTGYTFSFGAGIYDVLLLKFDSSGSLLWQKTWGGSSNDVGYGVAVDFSGNALVAGSVSEAPPYTPGTPSGTLGTPIVTPGVPRFILGIPTFMLGTPAGMVQTPPGSQSYAGGYDQFLIKCGLPPTTLSSSGVLLAAFITTVSIALVTRRRRFA